MMDAMFDICYLSSEGNSVEPDDIPKTQDNVWILGKKYNAIQGMLHIINNLIVFNFSIVT
jgi:hypothetical protein